jgi:PAS domain S-box-containing protein
MPTPLVIGDLTGAALDLLPIGVGVFDRDLRLVYCNRPFSELRDLPPSCCRPGTALAEIIRNNADRGDYGPGDVDQQVAKRIAEIALLQPREVERECGDGRRLLIRYTPVGDGGLLVTYSDVTHARALERNLRENEERYSLVSQAVAEGIYDWDIECNALWVSPRLIEIFAFEGVELTAADWNSRVHPADFAGYRTALRECFKGVTRRLHCEYRIRLSDGDYRWVEDNALPMRNKAGRAVRLVGALSDVSERKATEKALRDSEERHALAMMAINEGVYEWDVASGDMYYSPRVRDLVGLEADELQTAADWTGRIHPDDLLAFKEALVAHFKGEADRFEIEYRYRHSDDSWRWARQHGIALKDDTGRAYRVVGSTGDITAEKELARELERARGRLHDAVGALEEGFALFDPDDRLVICNSRYTRFFREVAGMEIAAGMKFEDFMRAGLTRRMFPHASGDPEAWMAALLARRRQGGTRLQYLSNGSWLQVSDYATKDGSLVSVYADVTDLKRRQQELEEAKEAAEFALTQLRAAQQQLVVQQKMAALGQLTAGIAHEIKNPLNFVNNFAGLSVELLEELKETARPAIAALDGDKRAELDEVVQTLTGNLEKIAEHGRRADGIVKSMLEHSRGASGERREVDLNALVEEALNLAYHGARAQDAGFNITLERNLDPAVAPIELAPQEMTRVFLNLFGNGFYAATKRARGNGEAAYRPTLQVSTRDLGEAVEVRVRDNGTGIPPEIRDQLFQPFFTTKPTGEGTGLGLSISWDIVTQQHGGSIEVDSQPGEFTEFTIRLPRSRESISSGITV